MAHVQETVDDYLSQADNALEVARRTIECLTWLRSAFEGIVRGVSDQDSLRSFLESPDQDGILASDLRELFFDEAAEPRSFARWLGLGGQAPQELVDADSLAEIEPEDLVEDIGPYRSMLAAWLAQARPFFEKWVLRSDRIGHRSGELELLLDPPLEADRLGPLYPGNGLDDTPAPEEVQDAIERVKTLFEPLSGPMPELFQMPGFEQSRLPRPRPHLGGSKTPDSIEPLEGQAMEAARRVRGYFDTIFAEAVQQSPEFVPGPSQQRPAPAIPVVDPAYPPHLKLLLRRLGEGIERGDPVGASLTMLECVDFLIRFFAAVTAGAVEDLAEETVRAPRQPETVECLEILQRCLPRLSEFGDKVIARTVSSAFYQDGVPGSHTRWLGLEGAVPEGLEPPAAWDRSLRRLIAEDDPDGCAAYLTGYLPVLNEWLGFGYVFFNSWDFHYSLRRDLNLAIRLARGPVVFDACPFVDSERYAIRLSQEQLDASRDDPHWFPAVTRDSGGLGDLDVPAPQPSMPPHLRILLEQLATAAARDDALAAGGTLLNCFDFLVRYYASLATGALRSEAPFPLDSVLEDSTSVLHCTKLLHYSLFAFESYPEHPLRSRLLSVFFRQGEPLPHTRWLGMAGSPLSGLENLAGWQHTLDRPDASGRIDELIPQVRRYTDLLRGWLEASADLFAAHHTYDLGEVGDHMAMVVEVDGVRFRGVPDLYVGGYGFSISAEQLRSASHGALEEVGAPDTEPAAQDLTELLEPGEDLAEIIPELSLLDSDLEVEPVEPVEPEPWFEGDEIRPEPEAVEDSLSEISALEAEMALDLAELGLDHVAPKPEPEPEPEPEPQPPARPSSWTVEQVNSFSRRCQALSFEGPESRPLRHCQRVAQLVEELPGGYILVEGREGVGKTLLSRTLTNPRTSPFHREFPVIHFSVGRRLEGDYDTFIEILNEHIREQPSLQEIGFRGVDSKVIRDLNVRYPADGRQGRFLAFLNALRIINRSGFLMILDGLDEAAVEDNVSVDDFLPNRLPEGVYLLVTARSQPAPRVAAALERILRDGAPRIELAPEDPDYLALLLQHLKPVGWTQGDLEQVIRKAGGSLALVRLLRDGILCDFYAGPAELPSPAGAFDSFLAALRSRFPQADQLALAFELLALLAAYRRPVVVDRLASLGVCFGCADRLVDLFPSVFAFWAEDEPVVGLAHDWFRTSVAASLRSQYRRACGILARDVLQRLASEEQIAADLERVYWWALESEDEGLLEKVAECRELAEQRRTTCERLERLGKLHQKVDILDGWCACLDSLVNRLGMAHFREELAWAYSSRGLAYLMLGQFRRAFEDIERATGLFTNLFEKEGQVELANGLAAAYNRRSEAYLYLGDLRSAARDADLAIDYYTDVVGSLGRDDLKNLLALAYLTRGRVRRRQKLAADARADITSAIEIYWPLIDGPNQQKILQELASAHNSRGVIALTMGEDVKAREDSDRAIELLTRLVEHQHREELRNELAGAYNNRAAAHHRGSDPTSAIRDYDRSLELRRRLVEEGRLDLRVDLARTYVDRGLVLTSVGRSEQALQDYDQAVRLRTQLVEGEDRRDLRGQLASAHLSRAATYRELGQTEQAIEDYTSAAQEYQRALGESTDRQAARRDLAMAHGCLGSLYLDCDQLERCIESCREAIRLYNRQLESHDEPESRYRLALANFDLGEACRRLGAFNSAAESYGCAVLHYERLLEVGDRPRIDTELATVLHNRAIVLLEQGRSQGAVDNCSRAIDLLDPLVDRDASPELCQRLASAYALRGKARSDAEDLGRAIRHYRTLVVDRALSLYHEQLAAAYRDRACSRAREGHHQRALDDLSHAIRHYTRASERGDDRRTEWRRQLAHCMLLRSREFLETRHLPAAVKDAVAAFEFGSARLEAEELDTLSGLLGALKAQGEEFSRQSEFARARSSYSRIIDLCRAIATADPTQDLRQEEARAYLERGVALLALDKAARAREEFSRAVDMFSVLVGLDGAVGLEPDLARAFDFRARACRAQEQAEHALGDLSRAIELYATGAPERAGNRNLAMALLQRAEICRNREEYSLALMDLARAVPMLQGHADQSEFKMALASTHSSLGMVLHLLGRDQTAVEECDRAIRVYRSLLQESPAGATLRREATECMLARAALEDPARDPVSLQCLVDSLKLMEEGLRAGVEPGSRFPERLVRSTLSSLGRRERSFVSALLDILEGTRERTGELPAEWLELLHPLLSNLFLEEQPRAEEVGRLVKLMEYAARLVLDLDEPVSMPSLGRFFELLSRAGVPRDEALSRAIQKMQASWEEVPSHVLRLLGVYPDQLECVSGL